jgi:uncharacterized membrane protein
MASSKSKARVAAQQRARAQAKKAAARTAPPVRATPTTSAATRTARPAAATAAAPAPSKGSLVITEPEQDEAPGGPPRWFQLTTLVLAVVGLGISAYETYAHFNGSHLLGCSSNLHARWDCTAVITSPQSMVFGVIPVAILGLAYYVVAVPLFSPWGWRFTPFQRLVGWLRLGSVIVGMGFVMYLIYAEFQINSICEYCTGVHIVTFLLFCMTVVAAALWGLGSAAAPARARRDELAPPD